MIFSKSKTSNRTVAYLDIVGFKKILNDYPVTHIGQIFCDTIKKCEKDVKYWIDTFHNKYKKCFLSVFSDSIVIFSSDDSEEGFRSVVLYAQRIMQHLSARQFLVRGAISFGEVFLRKDPLIFLGNGYMRAVELEGRQDWIGISIDKSVEANFAEFFEKDNFIMKIKNQDNEIMVYSNPSIVRYSVPMKCGHTELLYTVNWLDRFSLICASSGKKLPRTNFLENFQKALKLDSENKSKYNNTLSYIEYIDLIMPVDDAGVVRHVVKEDLYT